jgi:protein SCO1
MLGMATISSACNRGRTYELRGQVLAVDSARHELTVKHEDIRGFMPAMTMPYRVTNRRALDRVPGDLIRATLVVDDDTNAYLSVVELTGHAPVVSVAANNRPRFDILNPGDEVPDVILVDQTGASRRLSEFRGRVLAVTFIYTRCPLPDFCPRMEGQFAALQRKAADDEGLRNQIHLLSVSIDPAFDTPAVLAEHARRTGANPATWSFVTAERSEVDRMASRFGVSIVPPNPSSPDIVHNLRTVVIDRNGRLVRSISGSDWQIDDLLADMRSANGRG